ncbi:MAG TPA: PDZ domain-containing protein [Kofleriaceae bacterium]|nr:PDZ domain-containing protein [Kofleriaceae bacterium]
MKRISARHFLVSSAVLVALGGAGIALARPHDHKTPNAPAAGDQDSWQVTVIAQKGRLGLSVLQISPELRVKLGASRDNGVLVDRVVADTPASKAGVQVGDVIAEVDGDAVQSAADILDAMSERKKGEHITIALVRDGKHMDLNATLDQDPAPRGAFSAPDLDAFGPHMRGMLRDMPGFGSPEMQQQLDDARKRIDELEQRLDKLEH